MPGIVRKITINNSRTRKSDRNSAIHSGGTANAPNKISSFVTELSSKNILDKSMRGRDFLVDPSTDTVEREANSDTEPRSSNRNRCISAGVGISLPSIDAKGGGGKWNAQERQHHINALELKAAEIALLSLVKNKSKIHVHLKMDNTTAVSYVNKGGGRPDPQP